MARFIENLISSVSNQEKKKFSLKRESPRLIIQAISEIRNSFFGEKKFFRSLSCEKIKRMKNTQFTLIS